MVCNKVQSQAMQRVQILIQSLLVILTFIFIMVVSFVIIIWKVVKIEREMPSFERFGGLFLQERVQETQKNSKVILLQAFGCVVAFMITLVIPLLRGGAFQGTVLTELTFMIVPLQGLFNPLIFVAHKICNYRRVHKEISRW